LCLGNEVQSSEIDLICLLSLGLCRIVDREFREFLFQDVGE
jgi:hypothetical protein